MAVSSNGPQNDVDSLFNSSFWRNSNQSVFIEDRKLMLDSAETKAIDQEEENDSKASVDEALDGLLRSSQNMSLAELKPLPPFSGFSSNLNINGISGQHYQTISQQLPEENNNYACYAEQNIVSSSTCTNGNSNEKLSLFDAQKINFSDCIEADPITNEIRFKDPETHVKTEVGEYDISSIEDIAAIIGSAIADTTVPARQPEADELTTCSRDSWMDLDAWIDNACGDQQKVELSSQDTISEFLISNNNNNILMPNNNTTTDYNQSHFSYNDKANQSTNLHSLLSQNNMPLLQYRLENGPPIKQENSNASNYASEIISASNSPSNVVSTTDNLLLTVNERFMSQYGVHIIKENGNSDILDQSYPRSSSGVSSSSSSKRAKRPPKKHCTPSTTVFSSEHSLGMLGKEKPVHRCNVCNRGFLNKSNIKVHLRTHTGEKPFRCDTCAKAFRQKAHLLKHQQIHRRIGRD